jgi:hypothetical protein
MSLPWVRIDANIASHDKVLNLLDDPSPKRWQAFASYVCAIGWSADRGTDGRVPPNALPFIHANPSTARLLVRHGLWHETPNGWEIHNYAVYQATAHVIDAQRREAQRAACIRWHGSECWSEPDGCSRA